MSEQRFYYTEGTSRHGPMSLEEAVQRIKANSEGTNYVWTAGMSEWVKPEEHPEVAQALRLANDESESVAAPDETSSESVPESTDTHETHQSEASGADASAASSAAYTPLPGSEDPQPAQPKLQPSQERPRGSRVYVKEIPYERCDHGKRFLAFIIDQVAQTVLAIPGVVIFILAFAMGSFEAGFGMAMLGIVLLLAPLVYSFIKDGFWEGQSVGKRLLKLQTIVLTTGEPCNYGQSAIRNAIPFLINLFTALGWLLAGILVLADENGRRLGDRAADTMVIEMDE